jgi:hypothetical protein
LSPAQPANSLQTLNAVPFRADPRASPQIIYRIYFAMPKIPEIASQHKLCVAKNPKPLGNLGLRADWTAAALQVHSDVH